MQRTHVTAKEVIRKIREGDLDFSGLEMCASEVRRFNRWAPKIAAISRRERRTDVNLSNSYANEINLSETYLVDADLRSANLESADLRSADLWSADLWSADLWSANLESADLRSALFSIRNILGADWGALSDGLTLELMRHDAEFVGAERMERWANGGDCPYRGMYRDFQFTEKSGLWKKGKPKLRGKELFKALAGEKGISHTVE